MAVNLTNLQHQLPTVRGVVFNLSVEPTPAPLKLPITGDAIRSISASPTLLQNNGAAGTPFQLSPPIKRPPTTSTAAPRDQG